MKRGAIGGVCGGSNLYPKLFVELYQAISNNDAGRAEVLQAQVNEMGRALYHVGFDGSSYLRGIKAALSLAGLCRADPAPPFAPFSAGEFALVEAGYRGLKFRPAS
jgi:4-hydroxy-tetrahydrodipicolinate synthase